MPELFLKEKFENLARNDYEYNRWFKTPLLKAQYKMTERYIKEKIIPHLPNSGNFIEVGPGGGIWTKFFVEARPEVNFDLVDISETMLKQAKEKLANKKINYIASDFTEFYPLRQYDFFFSCRAIEYIPDKEAAISKVSSLLKNGGRGIIITKMPHYKRSEMLGRKMPELHKNQIKPAQLKAYLEKNGLIVKNVRAVTVYFPLLGLAAINTALGKILSGRKLNPVISLFTESYAIEFSKP